MSPEVVWLCGFVAGATIASSIALYVYRLRWLRASVELLATEVKLAEREMALALPYSVSADIDVYKDGERTVLEYEVNGFTHKVNLTDEQAAKLVHAVVEEFTAGGGARA